MAEPISDNSISSIEGLSDLMTLEDLFQIKVSETSDNITITFCDDTTQANFRRYLESMYKFCQTKDNKGVSTTEAIGTQKVVITIYHNKTTAMVQGGGCRKWLYSNIRQIQHELLNCSINNTTTISQINCSANDDIQHSHVSEDITSNLIPSPIQASTPMNEKLSKSSSFKKKAKSVIKAMTVPSINGEMSKLGDQLKKAKKKAKRGGPSVNDAEFQRQYKVIQDTGKKPSDKLHRMGLSLSPTHNTQVNDKFDAEETKPKTPQSTLNDSEILYAASEMKITTTGKPGKATFSSKELSDEAELSLTASKSIQTHEKSLKNSRYNLRVSKSGAPLNSKYCSTIRQKSSSSKNPAIQLRMKTNEVSGTDETHVKELLIDQKIDRSDKCIGTESVEELQSKQSHIKQLNSCESTSEDKYVQCTEEDDTALKQQEVLINLNKTLKFQNEELTKCNNELETNNNKQAAQLNKQEDLIESMKIKHKEQKNTISTLEGKLAQNNGKILTQNEQISQLKEQLKQAKQKTKENDVIKIRESEMSARIQNDLCSVNDALSDLQQQISTVKEKQAFTATRHELQTIRLEHENDKKEINLLKNEVKQLKENIKTPKTIQHSQTSLPSSANDSRNTSKSTNMNDALHERVTNASQPMRPQKKTSSTPRVFIIGDSVTKRMRAIDFESDKFSLNLRSNPGATIKDASSKLESKTIDVSQSDLIIVHLGINNVSNGDSPSELLIQYSQLVTAIQEQNKYSKICFSSVLPKKHDRVSDKIINDTNNQLKSFCQINKHLFIDNSKYFMSNGKVEKSLFFDDYHPNDNGLSVLTNTFRSSIMDHLFILPNSTKPFPQDNNVKQPSGNFHRAAPRGDHHPTPRDRHSRPQHDCYMNSPYPQTDWYGPLYGPAFPRRRFPPPSPRPHMMYPF